MKKTITFLMSLMLVFTLGACGNSQESESSTDLAASSGAEASENSENTESAVLSVESVETVTAGKILVVYYSASGSTETVANSISSTVGADVFELEPIEPYSSEDLDWRNDDSRVSKEHENENQRDVKLASATVDNWAEYDTVFIGYPIWWGIAAWPVDEFVQSNDFTGKTVIPFCTSTSSGLGESGSLLEEMAGTGNWEEGQRFRSDVSEGDISTWVESLNL